MEEKEALKRQIALLQDLINKHKSVHGDAPRAGSERRNPEVSAAARGGGFGTSISHRHSSGGRPYVPQSRGNWRKTYSLRNNCPQSTTGHPLASSSLHQPGSDGVPLPSHRGGQESNLSKTASLSSGNSAHPKEESSQMGLRRATERAETGSTSISVQHEASQTLKFQPKAENRIILLPGKTSGGSVSVSTTVKTNAFSGSQSRTQLQIKPVNSRTGTDKSRASSASASSSLPSESVSSALSASSRTVLKHSTQTIHTQVQESFIKKSKFTWVKSQTVEPKQARSASTSTSRVLASRPSVSDSSFAVVLSKRTPIKKLARRLSPVAVAPKTSKYKWVSSSGVQPRTPRKPLSPRLLSPAQRSLERGDVKRNKPASALSAKLKKGTTSFSSSSSPVSRYSWKAGGQSSSASVTRTTAASHRSSAFHWTAEKSTKGTRSGLTSPTLLQRSHFPPSSPGGFKLRSRMKIIRRSPSSVGASERGGHLPSVKFSPRARLHTSTRSPFGVRRTPSRELVSFGRHKLRRLSPASAETNPTFHRSPASQRVFRTRYKMVTRPGSGSGTTHAPYYNPALSWRAKKIQSARSFLQSRLRAPHDRHPPPSQRWAGSGMCWIRGSLYRVSANKLSRTRTANMSINRTGKSSSPQMSPALSRHIASRAVQRSIAIIRHARQKKQQKQYCMYYNRFGKCNRGTSCPFIHDPDKVAVCTRFLRGTCRQADGACPFSHKVAKEKMPVCLYFLKGICNNNECPYSHVYVSHKAEVCQDFVRGYCPEGEKCKKKHTLVCPDFSKTGSCPRGSRCKLHHRQRVKRSSSSTSTTPAKKPRSREPVKRSCLTVVMPQDARAAPGTPPAGSLALPSFISLYSSPEEADAPDAQPADTTRVKGPNAPEVQMSLYMFYWRIVFVINGTGLLDPSI
uniref:Zinc finger CCCH domain-containing protein 3 n=1 Tax=Iconisemion striatum TaxID=60296 RepID=A0A1A7W7P7_9TELE